MRRHPLRTAILRLSKTALSSVSARDRSPGLTCLPEFALQPTGYCFIPTLSGVRHSDKRFATNVFSPTRRTRPTPLEEERQTIMDCLNKIQAELEHAIDKHSRRLITANIGVLLDYCLRFYDRQFVTRNQQNNDIIVRFERLLDEYFDGPMPQQEGLPSVKYFADKVFLSPNYFGDMIRKQTGKTASEYIQPRSSNEPRKIYSPRTKR